MAVLWQTKEFCPPELPFFGQDTVLHIPLRCFTHLTFAPISLGAPQGLRWSHWASKRGRLQSGEALHTLLLHRLPRGKPKPRSPPAEAVLAANARRCWQSAPSGEETPNRGSIHRNRAFKGKRLAASVWPAKEGSPSGFLGFL